MDDRPLQAAFHLLHACSQVPMFSVVVEVDACLRSRLVNVIHAVMGG